MPYSVKHPQDWTLELMAEDALSEDEQAKVAAHVQRCAQCAAELEAYRSLVSAFAELPEYSPSVGFEEAVMARVQVAPASAIPAWLQQWLPSTRRGWTILVGISLAPAVPMIAALIWILTNPLVTVGGLWETATSWTGDFGWTLLVGTAGTLVESNLVAWGRAMIERLMDTPIEILIGGTLLFAVGIPLSAWTLYRTLRTPNGDTTYAH